MRKILASTLLLFTCLFYSISPAASEAELFEAIRKDSSAQTWFDLAQHYSKARQFEKVLKVTGKIMRDFPGNLQLIVLVHNEAVIATGKKEVPLIQIVEAKPLPSFPPLRIADEQPFDIEYIRASSSNNYTEIGLKVKDPRGQQIKCTVLDGRDKSMGTSFSFAESTYTVVNVRTTDIAHLVKGATCVIVK